MCRLHSPLWLLHVGTLNSHGDWLLQLRHGSAPRRTAPPQRSKLELEMSSLWLAFDRLVSFLMQFVEPGRIIRNKNIATAAHDLTPYPSVKRHDEMLKFSRSNTASCDRMKPLRALSFKNLAIRRRIFNEETGLGAKVLGTNRPGR